MTGPSIDPDDPEVRRLLANEGRRQRVQDATDQQVVDDLREQFGEG